MTMKTRTTRLLLIGGAVIAFGAGLAYAAVPGADNVINGCYEKRTGLLRVIDAEAGKKCLSFETPISWNQKGLKGDQGAQGPQGEKGEPGQPGADGVAGSPGIDGQDGADGAPGPPGEKGADGAAGPPGPPGADGQDGAPGPPGPPGPGLESFDELDGLPCTRNAQQGTIELGYDEEGFARSRCVVEEAPPAAQCADGQDNDGDADVDMADPGCNDANDDSESPDPPPPCVDDTANGTGDSAISLGTVSGDSGGKSPSVQRQATLCSGNDWWQVHVTEDDQSAFSAKYLSAHVTLQPTSGDPDLYVHCDSPTGQLIGSRTAPGLTVEVMDVRSDDDLFSDDTFDIFIRVYGFTTPTAYTLTVTGNTLAPTQNCDP
jgi:hypothetical protein